MAGVQFYGTASKRKRCADTAPSGIQENRRKMSFGARTPTIAAYDCLRSGALLMFWASSPLELLLTKVR